ncbi:phosphodiester glycosidase family protein [[Eubacterium] rectale]|uniref:phosphodiester glycosidase family protein n=1 Tax=Agathobacter rectalis TaxID=39491 RepID=UPI0015713B0D|nr:phosphodiester glycosidase family protein [Agathobacter rectalis]NSI71392.1 phosphodiester glycosidase family protein [Agathobacter rectalis]NSI76342.1 phosphodiester glycosidase family protein [Agathobacter rectalis]NSI92752.1 phosphodiester glycosidase family protein [Agathobacter rectalis]NSJ05591.1 phosphodiester glycosidase family protein [Agathobacter rectalis]
MVNGRKIGEGVYVIVLVIFTVYMLLDTFVITKKLAVVSNQSRSVSSSSDSSVSNSSGKSGSVTKSSTAYEDDNIKIVLIDYRENDTDIHMADVKVSSSEYLKTAFAQSSYGRNVTEKTSDIAESVNAILAINGDYYGAQESGYVIRNGVIYRETAKSGNEDLVIYGDGSFEIIDEDDITAEELLEKGAQNVLAFGPALVEDGSVSVTEDEEVGKAMASNPRTAIGIIDENHYVFVVADGRTSDNEGLSLYELAEFMESLGVQTAYNLDGGGSSTMYFNGQIINKPTTNGSSIKERSVSDIVYIGY